MQNFTESSTEKVKESGWTFLPASNFYSVEGTRPSIIENLQPAETEGVELWKAWLIRAKAEFETVNEETSETSGAIQRILLAEADTLMVLDALEKPPEPTPDLIAAFRRHRSK